MPAILALIPPKVWLYGALFIAVIVGVKVHDNNILVAGIAKQKAADDAATLILTQQTAKDTAALQAKATMAEQAYDKEHQAILDQPPLPAVRLCGSNTHYRSAVVSAAGTAKQGDAAAGAAPGDLQPVPAGSDSVGSEPGPDISDLLSLLTQLADDYSAELREYQDRDSSFSPK